jgi:hypothetical protein
LGGKEGRKEGRKGRKKRRERKEWKKRTCHIVGMKYNCILCAFYILNM